MNDLPPFLRVSVFVILIGLSILVLITTLETKKESLNDSEIPREILSVQTDDNVRPTQEYIVLMKDQSIKKFVDVSSDGIVDKALRPDAKDWTTEFKDDPKRAKAIFAAVLQLKLLPKSH